MDEIELVATLQKLLRKEEKVRRNYVPIAVEIGAHLKVAKDSCKDSGRKFEEWTSTYLGIGQRQAYNYLRVHKLREQVENLFFDSLEDIVLALRKSRPKPIVSLSQDNCFNTLQRPLQTSQTIKVDEMLLTSEEKIDRVTKQIKQASKMYSLYFRKDSDKVREAKEILKNAIRQLRKL